MSDVGHFIPLPVPSRINEAFHNLATEIDSLKRSNRALRTHNTKITDRMLRLERRLTGALYEMYGDWDKVNREIPQ